MKSTRIPGLALAGALGLAGLGVGVGAAVSPAVASAATTSTQAVTSRVTAIKNALTGLVKDGTITQAQADKVATTLDNTLPKGGFGGHHGGIGRGADLDAAASVIGVTTAQLHSALDSGKTLAQVAQGKGISQATLVDKLVAAEKTRIAAAVKAGQLTQAQATAISADLKTRITQQVTSTRPVGGFDHHDGDGTGNTPTPSTSSASPSAGTTTS